MTKKELFEKADDLKLKISEKIKNNRVNRVEIADKNIKIEFIYHIAEINGCEVTRIEIEDIISEEEAKDPIVDTIYLGNKQELKEIIYGKNGLVDNAMKTQLLKGITKAYDYAISSVRSHDLFMSVDTIKKLHFLIYEAILSDAGEYRTTKTHIFDTEYQGAAPEELAHLTEHFINQMKSSRRLLHPLEYAAICHKRIIDIYPFEEGTGLVAILLMNMVLENEGYGFAIIPSHKYSEYIRALMTSQREKTPDFDVFIKFIAECVIEAECTYLNILEQ